MSQADTQMGDETNKVNKTQFYALEPKQDLKRVRVSSEMMAEASGMSPETFVENVT